MIVVATRDLTFGARELGSRSAPPRTTSTARDEIQEVVEVRGVPFALPVVSNRLATYFDRALRAHDQNWHQFLESVLRVAKSPRADELQWIFSQVTTTYRTSAGDSTLYLAHRCANIAYVMSVMAFMHDDLDQCVEHALRAMLSTYRSSEVRCSVLNATLRANVKMARDLVHDLPQDAKPADFDALLRPPEGQRKASEVSLEELKALQKQGAAERPSPHEPRGSLEAAAPRRRDDIDTYVEILRTDRDEAKQAAAAAVIGEWGGSEQVRALVDALFFREAPRVRRAVATALARIGGPEAVDALLRLVATGNAPLNVRAAGLVGLLNLVTRDWDAYQMSPLRLALPERLRQELTRLEADGTMAPIVTPILQMFD